MMLVVATLGAVEVAAQPIRWARSEFTGGVVRVENATNFSGVSSLGLCCGQFTSATSDKLTITVGGEWPLTQFFMIGFRLGNANYSDEFTATNSAPLIIGDEVKDVTDIRGLNLDLVAKLFPVAGLWISAGIRTSVLLDRFATISVDSDVSAYRTSLNQGATYISGVGAIGYEIPLDSEGVFLLNPTIGASIGLADYNSLDWKINTLSAQIGVVWQWGTKLIEEADSGDQFR
jgi:hypothetical protein